MNGLMRRRAMTSKNVETIDIDRPNYWRWDFATSQENKSVVFGYVCFSNPETKDLRLDGSRIYRESGSSIKVPAAGNHTFYANVSQPYSNNSYRMYIAPNEEISYVRVPTRWTTDVWVYYDQVIPLVDLLTPSIPLNVRNCTFKIDVLRVPIETSEADIYRTWLRVANKIIKVKYNFIS